MFSSNKMKSNTIVYCSDIYIAFFPQDEINLPVIILQCVIYIVLTRLNRFTNVDSIETFLTASSPQRKTI